MEEEQKYAYQTLSGLLVLPCKDILLFFFQENNWHVMLNDQSTHLLRVHITAKRILSISSCFLQVRQDYIINLDYLIFIENKTLRCIFRSPYENIEVVVSRRYYVHVREKLIII